MTPPRLKKCPVQGRVQINEMGSFQLKMLQDVTIIVQFPTFVKAQLLPSPTSLAPFRTVPAMRSATALGLSD